MIIKENPNDMILPGVPAGLLFLLLLLPFSEQVNSSVGGTVDDDELLLPNMGYFSFYHREKGYTQIYYLLLLLQLLRDRCFSCSYLNFNNTN